MFHFSASQFFNKFTVLLKVPLFAEKRFFFLNLNES